MEAVDSFEFEMEILNLLHSRFHVYRNNCIEVFELSQKLQDTFMAHLSDSNLDASQVQDHFAKQSFLDDGHDI